MQYVQRKLQRSVTEIRRSWSGLPSESRGPIAVNRTRADRCGPTTRRVDQPPRVRPALAAGTSSGLHRTRPRRHYADTPRERPRPRNTDRGPHRMATTDAKPGFRLPWSADRSESEARAETGEAPIGEAITPDQEIETPDM